jgi:hypothetical protein
MTVAIAVGTVKGLFVLRSNAKRDELRIEGPCLKGWKVSALCRAPGGGYFAATSSFVYGPTIHHSSDLANWKQLAAQPAYSESSGFKLNEIWKLTVAGERVYAGVDEAGLFMSEDRGASWRLVEGLTAQSHRKNWFPGFGGLCCHSILVDPRRPRRIVVGISAVGVFRSDDDGVTWRSKSDGVEIIMPDADHSEIGWCVHALKADPADPDRLFRQDHRGVYVSTDAGDHWTRAEHGLESSFGFPLAVDPRSRSVFIAPMESDEYRIPKDGRLAVYRSDDGAASWVRKDHGLPSNFHHGVLRGAMDVDGLDPCGVYLGTTGGSVHWSNDRGESWRAIDGLLPRVMCVSAFADA